MTSEQASLQDLLVDEEQLNEELLAEVLSNYIRIGQDSGGLYPKETFSELNSFRKTAIILLAQHAKEALGLAESEWLKPSEISEISKIKKGTIHPAVRELEDRDLAESQDGSYRIPIPNLLKVKEFIEEADEE